MTARPDGSSKNTNHNHPRKLRGIPRTLFSLYSKIRKEKFFFLLARRKRGFKHGQERRTWRFPHAEKELKSEPPASFKVVRAVGASAKATKKLPSVKWGCLEKGLGGFWGHELA
jgi:hypothetical protein